MRYSPWLLYAHSVVVLTVPSLSWADPLSTAFTYQAQLEQNGGPLTGFVDFRFTLFDSLESVDVVGTEQSAHNVTVTDGVVAVSVDFGVSVFDGNGRWLEIKVRSPHDPLDLAPFTTLAPRQPITAIPYALQSRGIYVDEAGNVSIGTSPLRAAMGPPQVLPRGPFPPQFAVVTINANAPAIFGESAAVLGSAVGVKGKSQSNSGRGVLGEAPAEGVRGDALALLGLARGVCGTSASTSGDGVFGHATAIGGGTTGVRGMSDSPSGTGVIGEADTEGVRGVADAAAGIARGVCGISASTTGDGVMGHATAGTGTTTGVKGVSDSPSGIGVVGQADTEGVRGVADAAAGTARGVCGISASTTGEGVMGHASAGSGATTGVKGLSDSPSGVGVVGQSAMEGVRGVSTATTGTAQGICGMSPSTSGDGVFGHATATTGAADGVHGRTDSVAGRGVFGEATLNGTGVSGVAGGSGTGVRGETTGTTGVGVHGLASANTGPTSGVLGVSNSPDGRGVWGVGQTEGVRGDAASGGNGVVGLISGAGIGVVGKALDTNATNFGVHGVSLSDHTDSAGVLAEGNGNHPPLGQVDAAALEIRNGAINVSGMARPAGSIPIKGPWSETIESCATTGPGGHFHKVAHTIDLEINNELIEPNSIVLLTVEVRAVSESQHSGYMAHVYDKSEGHAMVRVTAVSKYGVSSCPPPSDSVIRSVHYLIINPLP